MRVLVIKTSSLGDVVHALPAVTDATVNRRDLHIDWVVEEAFAEIPAMHPAVERVIPVSIRRWRDNWIENFMELAAFVVDLRKQRYDLIVDGQGLVKSAIIAWLAKGPVAGFDEKSAKESVVSRFYLDRLNITPSMHAVERLRTLFAYSLGYELNESLPVFGLLCDRPQKKQLFFLHGTTWESKLWPVEYWKQLVNLAEKNGYEVVMTYGNQVERDRATEIAEASARARVLPPMDLSGITEVIAESSGVVSVDTGLGHLANALDKPLIALYSATSPELTGPCGTNQKVIASSSLDCVPCLRRECQYQPGKLNERHPPCFSDSTPQRVFEGLQALIQAEKIVK